MNIRLPLIQITTLIFLMLAEQPSLARDINDSAIELTDSDIALYQTENFNRATFQSKTIVLGFHHGLKVIAEHPCGDICPENTRRIVRYDVKKEDCVRLGGALGYRFVFHGDSVGILEFCVPPVLETFPAFQEVAELYRKRNEIFGK